MPTLRVDDADLYYEQHGAGPETIVFAHGLLWSGRIFDAQVATFKDRYRCITFDFRGQGQSAVTRGGYDMDTLAADATALIQALGAAPCHFVGLSMGGFIGLRLAARRPALVRSLVLLETAADPEPAANLPKYKLLTFVARWLSLGLVVDRVMPIMFGRTFLADPGRAAERAEWRQRLLANQRVGITRAINGVLARAGVEDELGQICVPTLVLSGDQDVAVTTGRSRRMQQRIPGAQLAIIPGAGHTSSVEQPAAVNAALREFLESV